MVRPTLPRVLAALAIGAAGGWAAQAVGAPLPWMIGAMGATTLASAFGLPIAIWMPARALMVAVLGVMLGSGFSPEILERLADWAFSVAMLALYAASAGTAGLIYFNRVCGYDPVTSYFAGMPGGLSEMILAGTEMGGDARIISMTQSSRLLLVVFALPFAFQLFAGYEPAARPAPGLPLAEVPMGDLAVLAACGIAGFFAARAMRIPAAAIVGPMVLSAAVHLLGWTSAKPPLELVAAAQVVVGAAIGCRFAGAGLRLIRRALVAAAGGTAVLLGTTIVFALAVNRVVGLPADALILAYSPGGLAEMSLIAIAIGADAAFVATHHIVRIAIIVTCAPLVFRFLRRRAARRT
jgi:membrane AbrB-like protein